MKPSKNILILFICCLLNGYAIAYVDATFCGRVGVSDPAGGHYTFEDLQHCDFKITPLDSNLTVIEYKITIVEGGKTVSEESIKGNVIPKDYRERILTHTKKAIYLEYIVAKNKRGIQSVVNPIAIRIDN